MTHHAQEKAMSDTDAYRREQSRQTQMLSDAIQKAITDTAQSFNAPMMNAVAGALVAAQGELLASIPRKHRKAMQAAMEKQLPKALARSLKTAKTAQTVVLGGRTH